MTLDELMVYCASKRGVEESFPFDEKTMVFKVMGKMFALTDIVEPVVRVNLKCDPERSEILRAEYEEIIPGYHMSKKHWNTVTISEGFLPEKLVLELIDHSYELVVESLSKSLKESLEKWEE